VDVGSVRSLVHDRHAGLDTELPESLVQTEGGDTGAVGEVGGRDVQDRESVGGIRVRDRTTHGAELGLHPVSVCEARGLRIQPATGSPCEAHLELIHVRQSRE